MCQHADAHTTHTSQVLAWLSILASKNASVPDGGKLVGVKDVAMEHWNKYGRNFFRCAGGCCEGGSEREGVHCHVVAGYWKLQFS